MKDMEEKFEGCLYALVPLACCPGFEIPVEELTVIHADCTYNAGDDSASLGTFIAGWISGPVGSFFGIPGALQAGKRLLRDKQTRSWYESKYGKKPEKPKTPPGASQRNRE